MSEMKIGTFHETLLPINDHDESLRFYQSMRLSIANESSWGLIQLERGTEKLPLVPHRSDLIRFRDQLKQHSIRFEDDIDSEPSRVSFYDSSGNEFQVMAQESSEHSGA